ncbi:MAG: aldose 1-epimerase family protein [Hespellia sp.]|nr:aldose 1-epimerase family protein [Hespellia sp.]
MEYHIQSDEMKVRISDKGGELQSVQDALGHEYLWQRDAKFWEESAPNLFPYIGRMTDGIYTFQGKTFEMGLHGFVRGSILEVVKKADNQILFQMDSNAKSREQYPFDFKYSIQYTVENRMLSIVYEVENQGGETMYFGIGGHPGFQVPMEEGLEFEDYEIEFQEVCTPVRILFSKTAHVEGSCPYKLEEGRKIPLEHTLFDGDAIVLEHAAGGITIRSNKGTRQVSVSCPDMRYIGFWHMDHTKAEYVCVEPWSSLPSRDGVVEDLEKQPDLISLEAGKLYRNAWSIMI